jgi:hypothetical protein
MSRSPIVSEFGTAIAVVCTTTSPWKGGPNARFSDNPAGMAAPRHLLDGPPAASNPFGPILEIG